MSVPRGRRWRAQMLARCVGSALAALSMLAPVAHAQGEAAEGLLRFSAQERARIATHGPWPPAPAADAGNRVQGDAAAAALGKRLFFDKRLSASGQLACASCHDPGRGFQDGLRFSRHGRNTPSLLNTGHQRWFGWDGAKDSLWAAALLPLTAPDEIGATPTSALTLLQQAPDLRVPYEVLFGAPVADTTLMVNLAKALAAYQATLVSRRTPFDDFRDALLKGDSLAAQRFPPAAQRGLKIFIGEGRCFFCHTGPTFSNGEFADIGRPFFTPVGADPGRWGGLQALLASPFNRLGSHSDARPQHASAVATRHVQPEPRNFGEFKVPGLRGVAGTAPYFHDGSAATLEGVVMHYSTLDERRLHADGARILRALHLSAAQAADLAAFLRSLTASDGPNLRTP